MFSHGLKAHRNLYSALCMELASSGYFVICLSHNDRSGDYTPNAGAFEPKDKTYDFEVRDL